MIIVATKSYCQEPNCPQSLYPSFLYGSFAATQYLRLRSEWCERVWLHPMTPAARIQKEKTVHCSDSNSWHWNCSFAGLPNLYLHLVFVNKNIGKFLAPTLLSPHQFPQLAQPPKADALFLFPKATRLILTLVITCLYTGFITGFLMHTHPWVPNNPL